ncbi:LOW QUALITY PROTEIN: hypothetical protein PHMEG_00029440 [Phytophthora megakarya]|uniref:Uncharacterized protein n=1 Tax=Phytophthora megakarya TaxID=4795 RepID=A0A225V2J1_9STRA|nr:LOW QUALITY PROTEIN: hypothetical protein PHMEG_00029440 [Phytophthora megakarya]
MVSSRYSMDICTGLHGSYSIERVLELAKYESKPNWFRDIAILVGVPLPCFLATVLIEVVPLGEANSLSFTCCYPPVAEWAKQIRNSPEAWQGVVDLVKLWMCDALMVFMYPSYFYMFTTLSVEGQRWFALLLPVIKLIMRNLFALVTVRLSDATPEFVVFHAEVFNSLFMSYCMQKSPSTWTSLQITGVDVAFTLVSLRDIECARLGLRKLERCIDKKHGWGRFHNSTQNGKYLERTTLDRASKLLKQDENQESARVSSIVDILHIASYQETSPKKVKSQGSIRTTAVMPKRGHIQKTSHFACISQRNGYAARQNLRKVITVIGWMNNSSHMLMSPNAGDFFPFRLGVTSICGHSWACNAHQKYKTRWWTGLRDEGFAGST